MHGSCKLHRVSTSTPCDSPPRSLSPLRVRTACTVGKLHSRCAKNAADVSLFEKDPKRTADLAPVINSASSWSHSACYPPIMMLTSKWRRIRARALSRCVDFTKRDQSVARLLPPLLSSPLAALRDTSILCAWAGSGRHTRSPARPGTCPVQGELSRTPLLLEKL
jgi:hypothetical protein